MLNRHDSLRDVGVPEEALDAVYQWIEENVRIGEPVSATDIIKVIKENEMSEKVVPTIGSGFYLTPKWSRFNTLTEAIEAGERYGKPFEVIVVPKVEKRDMYDHKVRKFDNDGQVCGIEYENNLGEDKKWPTMEEDIKNRKKLWILNDKILDIIEKYCDYRNTHDKPRLISFSSSEIIEKVKDIFGGMTTEQERDTCYILGKLLKVDKPGDTFDNPDLLEHHRKKWKPWEDFDIKKLIKEPPCRHCISFNPVVNPPKEEGVSICRVDEDKERTGMHGDFSCYRPQD